jgi:hypothetical protein
LNTLFSLLTSRLNQKYYQHNIVIYHFSVSKIPSELFGSSLSHNFTIQNHEKILILMGVAVMLCHTSCDSKKEEEKKEEIKLLVTSPLKKTQPPFTSL